MRVRAAPVWREARPPARRSLTWILYDETGTILGECRYVDGHWRPVDGRGAVLGPDTSPVRARSLVAEAAGLDPAGVEVDHGQVRL